MLNICVVAQRVPYPPNKGEKLRTFHQIERLVQLGHQVEVLALKETQQDEKDADALSTKLNISVSTFPLPAKLSRYLTALLKGLPLSVGAFYSQALHKAINERMTSAVDVMLFSASSLGYYVLNSSNSTNATPHLMMDFMDVDSSKWQQYAQAASVPMKWVYRRESKKIRQLESQINREFLQTFLIAEEEVTLFHRTVSDSKPVKVLGNGLDFDTFYPRKKNGSVSKNNFLFTGVMDYKPNVDAVCWFVSLCWPQIKARIPDATFTIAGMNPSSQVQALTKHDGIEVTGFVDDILPYFHSAAAFVAPFRIARGVQNKVLQAAACKLPIISTSMGAEGIRFANSNTLFIADQVDGFVDRCIDAVTKPELAEQHAQRAYDAILSEYSWQQQLKPLEDLLASL